MQNFLSAATGIAVLIALIRGFVRTRHKTLGNFWVDMTRSTLYVLLPLSLVLALVLVPGRRQNFSPTRTCRCCSRTSTAETVKDAAGNAVKDAHGKDVTKADHGDARSRLPLGPAASQIAIKQLGTNGGGFYNVNSAHPYENPTPLSNFLELSRSC